MFTGNPIQKVTRLLVAPTLEPSQRAARIQAVEKDIVLPIKILLIIIIAYKLNWEDVPGTARAAALHWIRAGFWVYVAANFIAAFLFIRTRTLSLRSIEWIVFAMGLLDGVLMAGLMVMDSGYDSVLYWVFLALILHNALAIPVAAPQLALNVLVSCCYILGGQIDKSVSLNDLTMEAVETTRAELIGKAPWGQLRTFSTKPPHRPRQRRVEAKPAETNQVVVFFTPTTNGLSIISSAGNGTGTHPPPIGAIVAVFNISTNSLSLINLSTNILRTNVPTTLALEEKPDPSAWLISAGRGALESYAGPHVEKPMDRLIVLLLWAVCCYGIQVLFEKQKRAEAEATEFAVRQERLQAAGRLAAEIAHKIKNPLGIITNAAFSLQRVVQEGPASVDEQIGIIREEVERADNIITELMGYAQLAEGKVEKLIVSEELDKAFTQVFPPGSKYQISIQRDYAPELPALLMQKRHLDDVLVNIIQNAREAMHGVGEITVSVHYGTNESILITIADNGPGIPKDKMDQIFEPYFTTREKGTGLGLAIVKHNTEMYGGTIRVQSELGKGTLFTLHFPARILMKLNS